MRKERYHRPKKTVGLHPDKLNLPQSSFGSNPLPFDREAANRSHVENWSVLLMQYVLKKESTADKNTRQININDTTSEVSLHLVKLKLR